MLCLDTCDAAVGTLEEVQRPLKELMVTKHLPLAENVVGLAFLHFKDVYSSRLDNLTPEQRIVLLICATQ